MMSGKNCGSCANNFGGYCTAKAQLLGGEEDCCSQWEPSPEYLAQAVDAAPWFLRQPYEEGRRSGAELLQDLQRLREGQPVSLNLYDCILAVYQLDVQQLGKILGVSPDVVGYARAHGTPPRRIAAFAEALAIPEELFRHFDSQQLPRLEEARERFLQKD